MTTCACGPITKIVCPLDFSDYSGDTLATAVQMGTALGAEVVFLNVINQHHFDELERLTGRGGMFAEVLEKAMATQEDDRAEKIKAMLGAAGADKVKHFSRITVGVPWEKILEVAEEEKADTIIMGARGRGSLVRQLRFGSSAEKVFRRAACRVMFVR